MIRLAAAADLHFGRDSGGTLRPCLERLDPPADLLLLAGDLTQVGDPQEAAILAEELRDLPMPAYAVLGNHDHHLDRPGEVADVLRGSGVTILEGEGVVVDTPAGRVGIAGVKGFGGGFVGACVTEFGEPLTKGFALHARERAAALEACLEACRTGGADLLVALMHYSPVRDTLEGEPPEIYPFLGSYLLAEAVDRAGAHIVFHGHAHRGIEKGVTPGGVGVRNVAQAVIRAPVKVYTVHAADRASVLPRPRQPIPSV